MQDIDQRFILIDNNATLDAKKVDGTRKPILKVNASDKVEFPEAPQVGGSDLQNAIQLSNAVNGEATLRTAADNALGIRIDTEVSNRAAAVSSALANAKSYTDTKISTLLGGTPVETLDTIKEIADQILADEQGAAALAATVANHGTRIAALEAFPKPVWVKENFAVTGPLTARNLSANPMPSSLAVFVGHVALHEGFHYTVSGNTVTFIGEMLSNKALKNGDVLFFHYQK